MESGTDETGGGAGAAVIDDRRDHVAQSASVPGSAGSCDGSADRLWLGHRHRARQAPASMMIV